MKRPVAVTVLASAFAFFSGCAVIDVSDKGSHTMVSVHNTGWELFSCIPIASGNPDRPNRISCRLFTDTATLENNVKMLDRAVKALDASGYKDLSSSIVDETVLFILVNRRVYHTSAELVFGGGIPEAGTNVTAEVRK